MFIPTDFRAERAREQAEDELSRDACAYASQLNTMVSIDATDVRLPEEFDPMAMSVEQLVVALAHPRYTAAQRGQIAWELMHVRMDEFRAEYVADRARSLVRAQEREEERREEEGLPA